MITPVRLLLALSLGFVVACDKDEDTADETGTGEATSDTGGEPIACGDIECAADQACLTFKPEPECTNNPDQDPCPPDTTEAQCGGAGLPCCCGPTPSTVTECVDPVCEGPLDCACLVDVCVPACTPSATPGVFLCEAPPEP